jgi:hypothetical protein
MNDVVDRLEMLLRGEILLSEPRSGPFTEKRLPRSKSSTPRCGRAPSRRGADHNDSPKEVRKLSEWVMTRLGPDVPLHFTPVDRAAASQKSLSCARSWCRGRVVQLPRQSHILFREASPEY